MPPVGGRHQAAPPAAEPTRGAAPAPAAERLGSDSPPSNSRSAIAPPALARPQNPMQGPLASDAAAAQRRAFVRLQPVCAPLLSLRGDPGALAAALERLEEVLPDVEPLGLAACLDYVLFPLMFIVDSAALLRAPQPPGAALSKASGFYVPCVHAYSCGPLWACPEAPFAFCHTTAFLWGQACG